jgi:hypothetical protein
MLRREETPRSGCRAAMGCGEPAKRFQVVSHRIIMSGVGS